MKLSNIYPSSHIMPLLTRCAQFQLASPLLPAPSCTPKVTAQARTEVQGHCTSLESLEVKCLPFLSTLNHLAEIP